MLNNSALNQLSPEQKVSNTPAVLTDENGGVLLTFLYNPSTLSSTFSATYATLETGNTYGKPVQYVNTSSPVWTLAELLVDTHTLGLSAQGILDRLRSLTKPTVTNSSNGKVEPPTIFFAWGTRSIGPAKLVSFDVNETAFLNGQFAVGTVNLTLQEFVQEPAAAVADNRPTSLETLPRTQRQSEEILASAKSYLTNNIIELSFTELPVQEQEPLVSPADDQELVRQALRDGTFGLEVSTFGRVLLEASESVLYEALPDDLRRPLKWVLRRVTKRSDVGL